MDPTAPTERTSSHAARRLDELLAPLRLPAVAAPMTGVSTPALVAAACAAGVIGSFPTSNAPSEAALDEWFDQIGADAAAAAKPAARTPGPVAANLIVGRQNRRLDADVDCVCRRSVPLVITSVGSPAPVVEPLHAAGCLVFADVASIAHARKALAAGADGLILLSAGAGGHTGWANPLAFVRGVRSFFDGPLGLAGGMADGAALWSAVCAGYDFGLFGTRFIATAESGASPRWRQALADATMDDITVAPAPNGVPASMLPEGAGSGGHTVNAVHGDVAVAALVDELEAGWSAARARTARSLAGGSGAPAV
ncbi:MAG: nitronate monooxygenase [Acidimicrobiales bacterium]